jgi:hypothetical protein
MPASEDEQVPGERIQFQVLPHERIQPVEALAHIAGRQAQIHPHAGRQLNHTRSRNTPSTIRNVAASTPGAICIRSPVARTSSTGAFNVQPFPEVSTNANPTAALFLDCFRQL